jgi:hypothetical protein
MAQREYADVTAVFAEATKAMPLGKMVHGADFNLWDASTHAALVWMPD